MPKPKEVDQVHTTSTHRSKGMEWVVGPEAGENESALVQVFRVLTKIATLKNNAQLRPALELEAKLKKSFVLEVIHKLAPDILLVIKVDSDSNNVSIIYVHSRYTTELSDEQVLAILENEKEQTTQPGTFWHRIMRPDVISKEETGPMGIAQQIGDFQFNFAIDKVVDSQNDQVFLILKGTEMPRIDHPTEIVQSNKQLVEEVWQLSAAVSELQNKHQDYVDETIWNTILQKAVMDFLSTSSMKLHAADKLRKKGDLEKSEERLQELKEEFEKLHALFESQPARQEKKDVPLLK